MNSSKDALPPGADPLPSPDGDKAYRLRINFLTMLVLSCLVSFIFYLLATNYRILTRSQEAYLEQLRAQTVRHAEELDHFFAECQHDLATLAEEQEIPVYFNNLALGMSKEYGLNVSLAQIRHLLERFLRTHQTLLDSEPIYRQVWLLDTNGMVLAEAAGTNSPPIPHQADMASWLAPANRAPVMVFGATAEYRQFLSLGYYFKGQYAGQLIAWIRPELLAAKLTPGQALRAVHPKPGERRPRDPAAAASGLVVSLLATNQTRVFPSPPLEAGIPEARLLQVARDADPEKQLLVFESQGMRKICAAYRESLRFQSLDLICAYDITRLSGGISAAGRLGIMTLLSLFILAGATVIFLLNMRSLLLRVRLNESVSRQRDIEGKNRLLEAEIAERKKVERALSRSEQNYREVFNATKEAIFIHRAEDGHILDVNQTMLDMYGYSRDEVARLSIHDLNADAGPFDGGEALEKVRLAQTAGPQLFEWKARRRSQEEFWVEVTLRGSNIGGQGCVLAVVRDITERKQAQEERERLEVQLRQAQKMEAVGQLAGGVAHDFNNLLQVILGNNEMAIAASGPNEAVGEHLQEIKSAAERAGSLVRQLLTFSRRVPLRLEPLNLETIIFDLGRMLRRLIGEHIDLDMGTAKSLHAIYADRGQIEQVFVNLCVNARDAMPDGGRIVIRVENTPRCDAAFDCQIHPPPLGFVRLTVSDNGVGMAKEIQEHIFEPFFTTKEVGKGTGLGLSTVYSILQRHEGHLHLTSEPGRGTFFQLYFPAKKPVATQEAAVNLASPAPGEGEMILLAEDEEMVRNLAVRVLGKGGYQVLAASDGEMALRIFEQHGARIRLAVLDVLMPRKNGSAVFRALKLANPELPCLFTTGYSYGALEQEHLPADTPIIQKPYLPAELLRQVQAILNK